MILGKGALWLSVWFVLNVSLTLMNKGILAKLGFKYPILMSFMHQSISTFLSFIEGMRPKEKNDKPMQGAYTIDQYENNVMFRIVTLSLLFTMNIVTGNISLYYCSVAFTQVVRAIIPMLTMIFSFFFLNAKYNMQHILSCLIICVGVALSCFGELNLTMKGFIITVIGCVLSSAKSISIKLVLAGQFSLKSEELLARIAPFSAMEMFALACYNREPQKILDPNGKYKASLSCIIVSIISGIIAYFLNLTNFLATHHTSPLTVTIAGCVKQIVTIILSVMMFDKHLTMTNILGIVITTVGSTWYSLIGFIEQQKKSKAKELADQENLLVPDNKSTPISLQMHQEESLLKKSNEKFENVSADVSDVQIPTDEDDVDPERSQDIIDEPEED